MGIQPIVLTKGRIVHILVDEGIAHIWIIIRCLPFLKTVGLPIHPKDQTTWMGRDQMGNVRVVQNHGTIKLIDINRIFFRNIIGLRIAEGTYKKEGEK